MEDFFEILSQCPLFNGIEQSDLNSMIVCLDGKTVDVPKGTPVFLEGAPARFAGVVLSGTVQVVREDYYGNRSIMTILQPGELFAEAFAEYFGGKNPREFATIFGKKLEKVLQEVK